MYAVLNLLHPIAKVAVRGFLPHTAFLDWRCLEYWFITFQVT